MWNRIGIISQKKCQMSTQRRKFISELKAEAVALVRGTSQSANQIAKELGASQTALSRWLRQSAISAHRTNGPQAAEEVQTLRHKVERLRLAGDILKKTAVGSTGHSNTIWSTINAEEDLYGANGASGFVCRPESRPVAAMEAGTVIERNRPCARQARRVNSRRRVGERGIHSCRPTTVALGPDVGGARRDFAGHGEEALNPADRHLARSCALDSQSGNQTPWWALWVSRHRRRCAGLDACPAP